MSDMSATVTAISNGFHIEGYEKITYDFRFVENIFDPKKSDLADCYRTWGRCLVIIDNNVHKLHGQSLETYFAGYGIQCTIKVIQSGELRKTMKTKLEILDTFAEYGLVRKEPVLVIGGGVLTDVAGYACASYRRTSNFIRIPTTLIGLIDASVSIKVGLNHGKLKNRLGAYHAPLITFLDFAFLKTLSEGHIRNGFAELIKISTVGEKTVFDLLDKYGEQLITTHFGYLDGSSDEIREAGKQITYIGIKKMLELE
jgi:3-dehydroquinate synthase